ncbi:MAG: TIGR02206 family membrane protein [Phycisphaerales bacterium]|nr:TIGR02206 family membrane protein [Phycisphaerales bacterium]
MTLVLTLARAATADDWWTTFAPFTLFHLVTVLACGAAMLAAAVYGHWHRGTPREIRFRRGWGWCVIAYQVYTTIFYASQCTIQRSLPLQVCDLAAFIAGAAMITQRRWVRTLLYFWGIGLSTQAFATPIIHDGLGTLRFWMFWIGHVAIVGSAVYDVVVGRYRPGLRDLAAVIGMSLLYGAVVMVLNIAAGTNYGYIGNTRPDNPTVIDKLGAWPGRVGIMAAIVITDFILLWAVWPGGRAVWSLVTGRSPAEAPRVTVE